MPIGKVASNNLLEKDYLLDGIGVGDRYEW